MSPEEPVRGKNKEAVVIDEAGFKKEESKAVTVSVKEEKKVLSSKILLIVDKHNQVMRTMLRSASEAELAKIDIIEKGDVEAHLIKHPEDKVRLRVMPMKGQTLVRFNKVGRNDKCPCGSAKKYKQCCLKGCEADPGKMKYVALKTGGTK